MHVTRSLCEIPPADRPRLREMWDAYRQESMPGSWIARHPDQHPRYFETRFAAAPGRSYQWWAKYGLTIVGFGNAELLTDDPGEPYGFLKDFYILPEHRRRGHGRAFAALLFQWLKVRGAARVALHVRVDNLAATAFWERLGCEPRLYVMRKLLE